MNPPRFNLQSARVTLKEEIKDELNFDESSNAWMLNKRRYGASYIYICGKPKCKNRVKGGGGILCKYHLKLIGIEDLHSIQMKTNVLLNNDFYSAPTLSQDTEPPNSQGT
jgi:hypothetical protein